MLYRNKHYFFRKYDLDNYEFKPGDQFFANYFMQQLPQPYNEELYRRCCVVTGDFRDQFWLRKLGSRMARD